LKGGCQGRGGSGYKAGSDRVTTHMDVAGGYVKEIWLVSGWAMGWQVKTTVLQVVVWNQESCISVQYLWKYGFAKSSDNLYSPCIL